MSSVADQWIEQGKEIGREEGREEGWQEGRQEGRQEAIPDAKREDVLRVIEERFDQVPEAVTDLVANVNDEKKLDSMLRAAVRAQTVEQLERMLREARQEA